MLLLLSSQLLRESLHVASHSSLGSRALQQSEAMCSLVLHRSSQLSTFCCALQGASMVDGSAILKPALARGTLRCLGCTSPDKFKKTVERDPALERRFQLVSCAYLLCLHGRCTCRVALAADLYCCSASTGCQPHRQPISAALTCVLIALMLSSALRF